MTITIQSHNGKALFIAEDATTMLDAVNAAVKVGANLHGAYLNGADLDGANLHGANLNGAYLNGADLSSAYLRGADLSSAYLHRANLSCANLHGADLNGANLHGADLRGADLHGADLSSAYLYGADLSSADLHGANLGNAYLNGADLRGADLFCANLTGADLHGAKGTALAVARTRILAEGALIGWKKCQGNVIVKLRIPEEAKRSHAFDRKCRAEFADVIEVYGAETGVSLHDGTTRYRPGERIVPDHFDPNWQNECSGGIHFYITREEAEAQ